MIVEVDENSHNNYDTTCEVARINEIYTDLGDRKIVLIRFNPDSYKDKDGAKIKSCFNNTKLRELPVIAN